MSDHEGDQARRDFNLALAGVVLPFAAFALSAALALKNARLRGAAQIAWTRRLVGLAVVDFLVLLAVIAFAAGKLPLPTQPAPPGPRVGVVLDERDRGEGAAVASVLPGSPADQAGIRAGDAVTAVDGQPVKKNAELTAAIGATARGGERTLTLRRGGEAIDVRARPASIADPPSSPPAPLFQSEGRGKPRLAEIERLAAAWAAAVGIFTAIVLVFRRRAAALDPPPRDVWVGFAGALGAADVALVATTVGVAKLVGGGSLGGALIGVFAGSGTLLVVAALWRRGLLHRGALAVEPQGARAPGTVLTGLAYIVAGLPRVGILLAAVGPLLHLPETDPSAEIRELVRPGLDPLGVALIVFTVVVLAPVGEETLFRGVLLPWLRRFLSPDAAAWASAWIFAAGHLRYGPSVLVVVVYGLVLAWARMRTGRLRAPIALHMCINAAAMAVTLLRH